MQRNLLLKRCMAFSATPILWCSPRRIWFTSLTIRYLSKLALVISEARSEFGTFECLLILFVNSK
jgi:hypothetical protein